MARWWIERVSGIDNLPGAGAGTHSLAFGGPARIASKDDGSTPSGRHSARRAPRSRSTGLCPFGLSVEYHLSIEFRAGRRRPAPRRRRGEFGARHRQMHLAPRWSFASMMKAMRSRIDRRLHDPRRSAAPLCNERPRHHRCRQHDAAERAGRRSPNPALPKLSPIPARSRSWIRATLSVQFDQATPNARRVTVSVNGNKYIGSSQTSSCPLVQHHTRRPRR